LHIFTVETLRFQRKQVFTKHVHQVQDQVAFAIFQEIQLGPNSPINLVLRHGVGVRRDTKDGVNVPIVDTTTCILTPGGLKQQ